MSPERVSVGCWVKVSEKETADEEVFEIVQRWEEDFLENKISFENPMGRVLQGAAPGDNVQLDGPKGPVEFTVIEIGLV